MDIVMPDNTARLAELRRRLRSRQGRSEYAENVKALEAEIARLEAQK